MPRRLQALLLATTTSIAPAVLSCSGGNAASNLVSAPEGLRMTSRRLQTGGTR